MRTYIYLLLLVISSCLLGCNKGESATDIAMIKESLDKFEASISSRSKDIHYCETIFTSKGGFSIGTQQATLDADGVIHFEGKSRISGYFVVPPMRWVDSLDEAKAVFVQEYKNKGGHTYQSKFHNAGQ